MNRGELRQYLNDLGKRTDTTETLVNGFITRAEDMIAKRVRAIEMVGNPTTLTETDREAGGRYTLPADFLGPIAVLSSNGYPLRPLTVNDARAYQAASGAYFYSIYGHNIEFRGAPATDAEFELIYYARPAAMTDDADEPLLLTNHPELYIHAGMFWYRVWSEDAELATAHRAAFSDEVDDVNALADAQVGRLTIAPSANLGITNHRSTM